MSEDIERAVTAAQKKLGWTSIDVLPHGCLGEHLKAVCDRYSDNVAFNSLGTDLTYGEWLKTSQALASYLNRDLKLDPGDKVIVQLPNILQHPVAMLACLRAGLVVVNMNPLYTADEFLALAKNCGAKLLITSTISVAVIETVLEKTPIETTICTDIGDLLPTISRLKVNWGLRFIKKKTKKLVSADNILFSDALKIGASQSFAAIKRKPNHEAVFQYTGGTTGIPKAAMLSHRNLLSNVEQFKRFVESSEIYENKEIMILPLPLYHIYAFMVSIAMLSKGSKIVLIADPRDRKAMLHTMAKHAFTFFCGLNTLFTNLAADNQFAKLNFSQLRVTLSGGMTLTPEAAKRWQSITGCAIWEGYGLSEASPLVSANPGEAVQLGTIGIPAPNTEVRVVDENSEDLGLNAPGELLVRGPQVMLGYWNAPEATAAALTDDGWLSTGDIAVVQPDGYLRIVDRKKDMIIVSGFNVYPSEVEVAISSHPNVIECAVIGVDDDTSGEAIKAFVVSDNSELNIKMIRQHCRQRLAPYKVPKFLVLRDDLPKSPVGKILRKDLRT